MAQTTINVRIDENLKKQFEEFCYKTGLNVSVAINIFVKTVVKEQKIPFEITTKDPFYSEENIKRLRASIAELNSGNVIKKSYKELKELEDE